MTGGCGLPLPETAEPATKAKTLPYLPGLDGLRALAVLAVVLYHAGQTWLPGGFLGVEVFFVISGYIITSGLLAEWRETGRIAFGAFWLRRARRLLPALFAMIAALLVLSLVYLPAELHRLRSDALAAAAYVTNWSLILEHRDYFETFARPPLLQHLWSLAVEEQFYVVWPLVMAALLRLRRPRLAAAVLIAGALTSAALMAALYSDPYDTARVYYATDTRASGLLLGSALAFAVRPGQSLSRWWSLTLLLGGMAGAWIGNSMYNMFSGGQRDSGYVETTTYEDSSSSTSSDWQRDDSGAVGSDSSSDWGDSGGGGDIGGGDSGGGGSEW